MMTSLQLDPLIPWIFWFSLAGLSIVGLSISILYHLRGWFWRSLSLIILLLALLQPNIMQEERKYLQDIVIIIEDQSSSQKIGDRSEQSTNTIQAIKDMLAKSTSTHIPIKS